ncbi:alpha/beta hydrolase [Kineococcus arenarius]|uniref:alpha/beta hydrolase n=1 Tax=unclassified Kineococcus TaxID=2621656 RepID=UPI003D7DA78C
MHGAWHGPDCWQPLVEALDGVDVVTVDLPSSGTATDGLTGLPEDAAEVSRVLRSIDGPKVVVAHSYGGAPVTEAVSSESGVTHLVYLCAFQLDVGESLLGLMGGQHQPWYEEHETHLKVTTPEQVFYNGVPPELTASAVSALRLQSRASIEQPVTRAAWREVPSTYVVCDADNAVPPVAQEVLAQRAGTVHHLPAGHSPFLSHPQDLAALLRPLL